MSNKFQKKYSKAKSDANSNETQGMGFVDDNAKKRKKKKNKNKSSEAATTEAKIDTTTGMTAATAIPPVPVTQQEPVATFTSTFQNPTQPVRNASR